MNIKVLVGQRLKEIRMFQLRISQDELASKLEWDRSFLSRVESGKQNITIENLYFLCKALNMSIRIFFDDEIFNEVNQNGNKKNQN